MNAKSLKAGLAGALVIAFVAGQAVAQEADCPKVDAEANVKALGIAYYPLVPKLSAISCLLSPWER